MHCLLNSWHFFPMSLDPWEQTKLWFLVQDVVRKREFLRLFLEIVAADMLEFFQWSWSLEVATSSRVCYFVLYMLDELISCNFIECGGCDWDMFALTTYINIDGWNPSECPFSQVVSLASDTHGGATITINAGSSKLQQKENPPWLSRCISYCFNGNFPLSHVSFRWMSQSNFAKFPGFLFPSDFSSPVDPLPDWFSLYYSPSFLGVYKNPWMISEPLTPPVSSLVDESVRSSDLVMDSTELPLTTLRVNIISRSSAFGT